MSDTRARYPILRVLLRDGWGSSAHTALSTENWQPTPWIANWELFHFVSSGVNVRSGLLTANRIGLGGTFFGIVASNHNCSPRLPEGRIHCILGNEEQGRFG